MRRDQRAAARRPACDAPRRRRRARLRQPRRTHARAEDGENGRARHGLLRGSRRARGAAARRGDGPAARAQSRRGRGDGQAQARRDHRHRAVGRRLLLGPAEARGARLRRRESEGVLPARDDDRRAAGDVLDDARPLLRALGRAAALARGGERLRRQARRRRCGPPVLGPVSTRGQVWASDVVPLAPCLSTRPTACAACPPATSRTYRGRSATRRRSFAGARCALSSTSLGTRCTASAPPPSSAGSRSRGRWCRGRVRRAGLPRGAVDGAREVCGGAGAGGARGAPLLRRRRRADPRRRHAREDQGGGQLDGGDRGRSSSPWPSRI